MKTSACSRGLAAACLLAALAAPTRTHAHGFAGERFFPATLATDDPFVADELSLPTVSTIKAPGDAGNVRDTDISFDISKRITPDIEIGLGEGLDILHPDGGRSTAGLDNLDLETKFQFFENDTHEAILSAGVDWEVGGTGSGSVGADPASLVTPSLFYGKGFGDLPDALNWLKPLAITGILGQQFRTWSADDNALEWGFALEYSTIYLQSHVKNIGLPAPFDRVIPLVEFSLETPETGAGKWKTTGTVNPGFIWSGKYFQVGVEAVIPVNSETGNNVGVLAQLHFYLDDIFPNTLGRPLFGK